MYLSSIQIKNLRDAHSDMQSGRHSRLSQIIQHIPTLNAGTNEYQEGMDLKDLSLVGIANLSNDLLVNHPALSAVNTDMEDILRKQMLLKQDDIKTRFEVADSRSKDMQKINALLEKLDLVVDKHASSMQGNRDTKKLELIATLDAAATTEEKAARFYSFFTSKKASKADFAQRLAYNLCNNASMTSVELKAAIPPYLHQAIEFVVGS